MNLSFKLKIIKKTVCLILATLMLVNPLVAPVVYAEGEETLGPTPTETPLLTSQEVSPSPTPTELPQSTINTGGADAATINETTANSNANTVDINIDNQASVSGDIGVFAQTGTNTATGSGNVEIDTGDATASGQILNDLNTNIVAVEPALEDVGETNPLLVSESLPTPTPQEKEIVITNENNGELKNEAEVVANTGENIASENLGSVDLNTGDAQAWVNLLNFLNTNIVGSNFEIMVLDIKDDTSGEVNLNEIWKNLQSSSGLDTIFLEGDLSSGNLRLVIKNNNDASLNNTVNVCAATGSNQANQNNEAQIQTGDAMAMANVTNMVNTNILGSKFFFGIINITGKFTGNLILPPPESFISTKNTGVGGESVVFENQNFAIVNSWLTAVADSGENQVNSNGGNDLKTGDANSIANEMSLINLNLYENDWFYLLLNTLGSWSGNTYGWSNPEAVEQAQEPGQVYGSNTSQTPPETKSTQSNSSSGSSIEFQNQNIAKIENNINVLALTGGNEANNNINGASVSTGNAKAGVNLINLINLNILSSRWFMGLVNILGNWSGNTIFAYPDLTVNLSAGASEVSPGDLVEYNIDYINQGYEKALGVLVKAQFPKGVIYESDDSGLTADCNGNECVWNIGDLNQGQSRSFKIRVRIAADFLSLDDLSFWEKLIPKVYAAEEYTNYNLVALITTDGPELSKQNNSSSVTTSVMPLPAPIGGTDLNNNSVDQRKPVLEISASNNVNEFIYHGDTITFEVKVKNSGDVRSDNTYLTTAVFDGVPEDFGIVRVDIGVIEPGKTAKVNFGLILPDSDKFHAGSYYTITKAIGKAPNGDEVSSGEARTDLNLRIKTLVSSFDAGIVEAAEERVEENILGESIMSSEVQRGKIYPYILLFVLSSLWIVERSKRFSERYLLKNEKN